MKRLLAMLTALGFAACHNSDPKAGALETAEKRVKVGAYREAIRNYEDALDGTAKTADIHYKIAALYDDKLKSPLDAIHHYDRCLELDPKGAHAKECEVARKDCEQRLHAIMNKGGFMTPAEAVRLRNENESLRKIINDLRSPKPPEAARIADPAKKDKLPPGAKSYTVEAGDTLAAIAYKFYKNRSMASQIKDANFNQLGGKDAIKPGQVLIIPERAKKPR